MPAPSGSKMSKDAQNYYGQKLGVEGIEYVDKIFEEIEKAWSKWQNGVKWGGLTISGAGVGAWTGVGQGGGFMIADPFVLPFFIFKQNTPQQAKFQKALSNAIAQKFNDFTPSFKFSKVDYIGSSGASPINPGPVSADAVGTPLTAAGSGKNPSGLSDLWRSFLGPPDFFFNNPNAKSGGLLDAISRAIEQSFQTVWLATTMLGGNTISTGGAPGGVVGGFMSPNNGKLS